VDILVEESDDPDEVIVKKKMRKEVRKVLELISIKTFNSQRC
jgi:hypothetical protein